MNNNIQDPRLDTVLVVKEQLSVRLGSCQLMMRDVLELAPGAIVQLDQKATDSVGLYINDQLIARGEVVVIEENFGIKVTELACEEEAKK